MNENTPRLKKAKFWNMILLIFGLIGGIIGVMGLPAVIDPAKQVELFEQSIESVKDPQMIESMAQSLAQMNHPLYRGYTLVMLLLSLILVACFFQANRALNKQQTPSKWPYYVHLGKIVLAIALSIFSGAVRLNLGLSVTALVLNGMWCLPAILVLRCLAEVNIK